MSRGALGMTNAWVMALGRRDFPTDGVDDYCRWLGGALEKNGLVFELVRVDWHEQSRRIALRELKKKAGNWQGRWVLLQYTALAWSRRGFPLYFLRVLRVLRDAGAKTVVVFHDAQPYGGLRWVDRIRRACQIWVMRQAYRRADHSVLTVPIACATWLPNPAVKAAFVPVGANLQPLSTDNACDHETRTHKTVAVYGVTGGPAALPEVRDIGHALKRAKCVLADLRLVVLGRGSSEAEWLLRRELAGTGVELSVRGLLPPEEVAREIAQADVLLFVRGGISSRRGSALAAVACELPVVGYRSEETAFPVTEAGVVLVPLRDREALGEALTHVLANDDWRQQLRQRSRIAQEQHFSWEVISQSFLRLLNQGAVR